MYPVRFVTYLSGRAADFRIDLYTMNRRQRDKLHVYVWRYDITNRNPHNLRTHK